MVSVISCSCFSESVWILEVAGWQVEKLEARGKTQSFCCSPLELWNRGKIRGAERPVEAELAD